MNPETLRAARQRGWELGKKLTTPGDRTLEALRDGANALAAIMGWPAQKVESEVLDFHKERMQAVPDLTQYPELRGYIDAVLAEESGALEGGLDEASLALCKTFHFWRDTRLVQQYGYAVRGKPKLPEKCRILYLADSDRGALRLKNVDDPLTYWKPRPTFAPNAPWPHQHPLVFDGVGSNLHIDDPSPEIFPVDVRTLCEEHCTTVPAAEEFMVRYNHFWYAKNYIIHDYHGNSVAIEKTRCLVATRGPNSQGINFVNGMGALNPEIAAHFKKQRQKFLDTIGAPWEGSTDGNYFTACENKWHNMTRYVEELSAAPTWDNAKQLMEQRDASGPMCLTGKKTHPDEIAPGCTLVMDIYELDNKRLHRRQWRGDVPAYLDKPELVQFTD